MVVGKKEKLRMKFMIFLQNEKTDTTLKVNINSKDLDIQLHYTKKELKQLDMDTVFFNLKTQAHSLKIKQGDKFKILNHLRASIKDFLNS